MPYQFDRGRSRRAASRQARVRSRAAIQSRQGLSDTAPMRRARARARACRAPSASPICRGSDGVRAIRQRRSRARATAPISRRSSRGNPRPLEPCGRGSKRSDRPPVDADLLDLSALDGILDYRARGARADCTRCDAARGDRAGSRGRQASGSRSSRRTTARCSASRPAARRSAVFSPPIFRAPGRITGGAARDHFLGFEAVTGRGERFKAGGRVVKNVTGYDLPKLLAGSWGTLAVLTEADATRGARSRDRADPARRGDHPEPAIELLTAALGSSARRSAAAYDPWRGAALRLEGFAASVAARAAALCRAARRPDFERSSTRRRGAFWAELGGAEALADWPVVWRISVPPSQAAARASKRSRPSAICSTGAAG